MIAPSRFASHVVRPPSVCGLDDDAYDRDPGDLRCGGRTRAADL